MKPRRLEVVPHEVRICKPVEQPQKLRNTGEQAKTIVELFIGALESYQ